MEAPWDSRWWIVILYSDVKDSVCHRVVSRERSIVRPLVIRRTNPDDCFMILVSVRTSSHLEHIMDEISD